ncbi:hypothetical protein VP01_2404g7 [Puccinia sorghi]|uniref:Uncharacterized protein n=1 Tax=Puccinia sorghi TaxID=27349 RepID=A0A0L6V6Q3_9BASI|nr:hypothetical protein VP01_2404g7 [Puccinia sorghi]
MATANIKGGYSRRQMQNSRDFIKTALYYPEIREEICVLVNFCLKIYPTYEELYKATSAGRHLCGIENRVREVVGRLGCPLCKNKDIKYSDRNHVHLLLHCTYLKELRDKHLTPLIKRMHSDFNKGGLSDLAMADLLLGAYCCVSGPEKPERRQEARKGSPIWWTIRRFQLGWGQLTGRMPDNMCEYGFVPRAKFLYTSLKLYFRECEEILETLVDKTCVANPGMVLPKSLRKTNPDLLEGIKSAGSFLWRRIQGLSGFALQKGQSSANSDGLGFLLKRIHEMLLGIALVIESQTILSKEAQFHKEQSGAINNTDLKRFKWENLGDFIFCKGPPGVPTKVCKTARCGAYASLAMFSAFGVAGWFSQMTNWLRYLLSDIYGIITLSHKKYTIPIQAEDNTLDSSHPLRSGTWKYLNSHDSSTPPMPGLPTQIDSPCSRSGLMPLSQLPLLNSSWLTFTTRPLPQTLAVGRPGMSPYSSCPPGHEGA